MESKQIHAQALVQVIKTQPKNEENEIFKIESLNHQNGNFLHCKNCEFLTFSQELLSSHNCTVEDDRIQCPGFFLCRNTFTSTESLKIHLQIDHKVTENELEKFIRPKNQLKKPETQSKSKIFIKDVTLLRKPDLPTTHINLPNIFDSLDLTTTDEDIFDDFLATDNEPDDFDFDFEEPAINNGEPDDEIIAIGDGMTEAGKIYVTTEADEVKSQNKIYVRSHESLTSQIVTTEVPSESSTPDCVIVSSEIIKESPAPNKIFIRNIETLTNPQQTQDPPYYDSTYPTFQPSIYVRSYDSLVSDSNSSERCKISIKNMDTLIEPSHLMHPPGIFGHPQNLVIHMRPNQTADESLIGYRDTSVTPDTLPGSSNVSTCGGTDNDVIILDELTEASFEGNKDGFDGSGADFEANKPSNQEETIKPPEIDEKSPEEVENPERNQTPNDKPKIDIQIHENEVSTEDQPMTRIPMDVSNEEIASEIQENLQTDQKPSETDQSEVPKKKMKIIKIIRVKKKPQESTNPLNTVQVVFKCNFLDCSLSFSNSKLLNYHKRCHTTNETQIICPECKNEDFKNFTTLHTHLWRQHGIDMDLFACKICNFKTPILSRLKNFHEKIHSDEKNFKCEFLNCGKKFCNSKQLKNHSQIHKTMKIKRKSDEMKKIRCQICNKGFASESGLYIHFMEHKNDEKRFICEEKSCQYSTNDHNSFRRHKFQHSKTHQYSCPACDYTSIQSNTYRKHLEKQHKELAEELLYKCGSCKFITISKSKYDGHVSKHLVDS